MGRSLGWGGSEDDKYTIQNRIDSIEIRGYTEKTSKYLIESIDKYLVEIYNW